MSAVESSAALSGPHDRLTSGYSQHSHDADDGGVDGQEVSLDDLQDDAHNGQDDDEEVKLVPSARGNAKESGPGI